jgi:tetratricopeptide (TPR) repeat protein
MRMNCFQKNLMVVFVFTTAIFICGTAFGATSEMTNKDDLISSTPPQNASARIFYNAGTEKLRAGKLDDAETLLESSLAKQDERVQPAALFNLGHVRFAQGVAELKKSPDGVANQGQSAAADGATAIQTIKDALTSEDVQQMVAAYLDGRGARREIRSAMEAVQKAMDAHGRTLLKWQRALDDFKSAAELNPADTNATHNAQVVEQEIARLVDSLRKLQQLATNMGDKKSELDKLLKELKGKIPAPNMPPGAAGGKDDDDDGKDGKKPSPESLSGMKESDQGGGGQETGLKLSAEQAGQLMNSLQPDGKQLPMGANETGQPQNHNGRIW